MPQAVALGNSFTSLSHSFCICKAEYEYSSCLPESILLEMNMIILYNLQGALKMKVVIITAIATPIITSNDLWTSQIFCRTIKDNLLIFAEATKKNLDLRFIKKYFFYNLHLCPMSFSILI